MREATVAEAISRLRDALAVRSGFEQTGKSADVILYNTQGV